MEPKERILKESDDLFRQRGIRSVTMNDIAGKLGMSKKTLYQYFKNKAEIVLGVTQCQFEYEEKMCNEIWKQAGDPIEEMLLILKAFAKILQEIPPTMIYEIMKYYPESWNLFHKYKNSFVYEALIRNLKTGMETGLYRKEMNIGIVAKLRIAQIEGIFDSDVFPPREFDLVSLQTEQFKLFLHGLVTIKGKKLIYQYLNQSEDE